MGEYYRVLPKLEPDGGNLYEAHPLMVNSGQFWRCAHGVTGFGKGMAWIGCPECCFANPVKAAAWEQTT